MQRGFIQIPILIAIILGVFVVGGTGYVGVKQYQSYQAKKMAEARERQAQDLIIAQQQALEDAQQEIEKIRSGAKIFEQRMEQKISSIESKLDSSADTKNEILTHEIEQYITGVVELNCFSEKAGGDQTGGSGFLYYKTGDVPRVFTNRHVAFDKRCIVSVDDAQGKTENIYYAEVLSAVLNKFQDFAILKLTEDVDRNAVTAGTSLLNNEIHSLNNCPNSMPLGSPVVVVGYPASVSQQIDLDTRIGQLSYIENNRSITNGIISSYDNSVTYPTGQLPYPHYFVSAKIDSGNSGGIALSKNAGRVCVLGIPTWLNIGNYDAQGIVQNMNNIVKELEFNF